MRLARSAPPPQTALMASESRSWLTVRLLMFSMISLQATAQRFGKLSARVALTEEKAAAVPTSHNGPQSIVKQGLTGCIVLESPAGKYGLSGRSEHRQRKCSKMPALSRATTANRRIPRLWKQHFAEKFAVIGSTATRRAEFRNFLGRSPSKSPRLKQGQQSSKWLFQMAGFQMSGYDRLLKG